MVAPVPEVSNCLEVMLPAGSGRPHQGERAVNGGEPGEKAVEKLVGSGSLTKSIFSSNYLRLNR